MKTNKTIDEKEKREREKKKISLCLSVCRDKKKEVIVYLCPNSIINIALKVYIYVGVIDVS